MERGQVSEIGDHASLLRNPQGIYSHLYRLQSGTAQEKPPQAASGEVSRQEAA
jgi:hypothetical protein